MDPNECIRAYVYKKTGEIIRSFGRGPEERDYDSNERDGITRWAVATVPAPTAADLKAVTQDDIDALRSGVLKIKKDAYPVYSDTLPLVEPRFDLTRRFLWEILQTEFNMTKAEIAAAEKKVWDEWQDGTPYQK